MGELIYQRLNFQANDSSTGTGRDGKVNSINAGQDVYVYLLEVVCEKWALLSWSGDVTLIR